MKRRKSVSQSAKSAMRTAIEALESRVHLDASPWAWNASLVKQPQAITDFPYLTGSGETVVVLDTGIDQSNAGVSNINVQAWQDFVGSSSTPVDTVGHGTGVSSIIAGAHFDFDGVQDQGVAPGLNLIVLRTDTESPSTSWKTQAKRISDALTWVIDNLSNYNIVAVNMSTGSNAVFTGPINSENDPNYGIDSTLQGEFATLAADGIFLGAAAGNDGASNPNTDEYPAVDPNVFAASSVNSSDRISSYASQGALTDILAPGENDIMAYGDISGSDFINYGTGTSFSSPYMVGTAALLKQVDPNLTAAQVMQIMQDSGTPQFDSTTGNTFDLLNIDAAIKLAYSEEGNANQSLGTAASLNFDSNNVAESGGNVSLVEEKDYYKFSLGATSDVTFSIATSDGETAPTMQLLNSSGGLVESIANGQSVSVAAGTYYVKVTGGGQTLRGTYTLVLSKTTSNTQNNHTPESATPINVSSGFGESDNNVLLSGETDYYSFVVGANSNVAVAVDPNGSYPTVNLLNANTTLIASVPSGGTTQSLGAGTYLIAVASNGGGDETYKVTVSVAAKTVQSNSDPASHASAASIAYDSLGNLYMAYYDTSTRTLQFAERNTSGVWSNPVQVDPTIGAGTELSIAVAPDGNPGIAYYDSTNANLKYAFFNGATWEVSTPDYYKTTGLMPSLTYNSANQPLIAYYDKTYGELRLATMVGSTWSVYVMDSGGVGLYPSISYDSAAGVYAVAYEDAVHDTVKYAYYRRGFRSIPIAATRAGGTMISLAINPTTGAPAVSFYDVAHTALDYVGYANGVWTTQAVTSSRNQGEYSSLEFINGIPDILYYTPTYNGIDDAEPVGRSWTLTRIGAGGVGLDQALSPDGTHDSISWIVGGTVQVLDLS